MDRRSFLVALAGVASAPHLLEGIRYNPQVIPPLIHQGDTQLHAFYGPRFRPGDKIGIHGDVYTVVHAERSEDGHTGCITLDRPIAWRGRTRLLTPREVLRVFG